MIITYIVKDNDTIESIAEYFYHDRNRWIDIVTYNQLDYPYISLNPQDYQTYASGNVIFSLPYTLNTPVTIPQGTIVIAPGINTQLTRYYQTTQPVTIYPGQLSATVNVQCTVAGDIGNIGANRITQIQGPNPYNLTVTNPQPFTNGKQLNVATVGTVIYIPLDGEVANTSSTTDYYAELCKADIYLDETGEFLIAPDGDLLTVSGLDNLALDLKLRLETPKGEYIPNPNFGSNLLDIATSGEPYAQKLLQLEVEEVLKQDPRIKDVTNVLINTEYPHSDILVNIVLINESEERQITIRGA